MPLAEMLDPETGISLGLLLTLIGLLLVLLRQNQKAREDIETKITTKADESIARDKVLDGRVAELEMERRIRDAVIEDRLTDPTPRPFDTGIGMRLPTGRSSSRPRP